MQERINKLMNLTSFELQKRALATLIAIIEDESIYDDVKKEAIKALPSAQESLLDAQEMYDEAYDEVYEDAYDDVICELVCDDKCICGDCECEGAEEGNNEKRPDCCKCEKECTDCEHEEKYCLGADCGAFPNPREVE